jgi:hypothetical protein
VLSEHARSAEPRLRIDALWVLKNLFWLSTYDIAQELFDELGSGFLYSLLVGQTGKPGKSGGSHLAAANAYGVKVDLLNEEDDEDDAGMSLDDEENDPVSDDSFDDTEDDIAVMDPDDESSPSFSNRSSNRIVPDRFAPSKAYLDILKGLQSKEESSRLRQQEVELRTQHHSLDLIRNLTGDPHEAMHPELVDLLLREMGETRIFDMILGKLKPKVAYDKKTNIPLLAAVQDGHVGSSTFGSMAASAMSRRQPDDVVNVRQLPGNMSMSLTSASPANTALGTPQYLDEASFLPDNLLETTVYLLAHIANGTPHHRNLVMNSHRDILVYVCALISHPSVKVRIASLCLVHNLMWVDGPEDAAAARARAVELRRLGFEEKVRRAVSDGTQDVRERARSTLEQFTQLLDGGSNPANGGSRIDMGRDV